MAAPSTGSISLYGIAKELELNNYYNTVPISTYNSYYATPISLKNMSTGAGGFDPINTGNPSTQRPDGLAPHSMDEFRGYDHDYNPGTTPSVSTSSATWTCKNNGALNMVGIVNTSPSGHATTEYGFVYSPNNSSPTIGGFGVQKVVVGNNNYNGFYNHTENAILMPCCCGSMDYYVRAYAINSIGTAYGGVIIEPVTDCSCGDGGDGPDGPGGPGGFI